jgi:Asp-tRNA(Asn)/Glu-tRNA(Gln) amidotransferase A subunit family amidase
MNVTKLATALRTGQLDLHQYLTDLESHFTQREPAVLSFVPEVNRFTRLRRDADELLKQYPDPKTRPPLFGIPVGVKDIFHVAGFITHAGSKLPAEELQGEEARSVTRLKDAGALIMGKTVTTEFAFFGPGPTHNPHNPAHTPGGSSSGSAASVGGGLCPLTLGTQTIGSVIRPASFCGCVGYKPTYDRISRAGVIPLSPTFDHIGVFASDVAGVELAGEALIEEWPFRMGGLETPVLAIPTGPYLEKTSPEMLSHFDDVCRQLAQAGYEIKRLPVLPDFETTRERHYTITAGDAARVHRNWYPRYRDLYHPKTVELLERGQGVTDSTLQRERIGCNNLRSEMSKLMDDEGIDLWITPSAVGPAPEGLESTGDPVMNLPWSQVGFPSLNLPTGKAANGLPLGTQFVGKWNEDEAIWFWGKEIEALFKGN